MKDLRNPIYISVDEWGTFGRNFRSVLPIAQCLNSFIRHADVVKMANFTMFTCLLASDRDKGDVQVAAVSHVQIVLEQLSRQFH